MVAKIDIVIDPEVNPDRVPLILQRFLSRGTEEIIPIDPAKLKDMKRSIYGRYVIVNGDNHASEMEEIVKDALFKCKQLIVIVSDYRAVSSDVLKKKHVEVSCTSEAVSSNIRRGDVKVREIIIRGHDDSITVTKKPEPLCGSECKTISEAVIRGHLNCLIHLHKEDIDAQLPPTLTYSRTTEFETKYLSLMQTAAQKGHLPCLQYMCENLPGSVNIKTVAACDYAALGDQLCCLEYLVGKGFPITEKTSASAAETNSIDCLKYLYEVHSCPWDETLYERAAKNNSIECMEYAMDNGCTFSPEAILVAAKYDSVDILGLIKTKGYWYDQSEQGLGGDNQDLIDVMFRYDSVNSYKQNFNCKIPHKTFKKAVRKGSFNCIRLAHERGALTKRDDQMYTKIKNACETPA
jgi:hypothetical protein